MSAPEQVRALFAQRDAAAAFVAHLDQRLADERRRWSDANGYRIPIRPEAFRREVGA